MIGKKLKIFMGKQETPPSIKGKMICTNLDTMPITTWTYLKFWFSTWTTKLLSKPTFRQMSLIEPSEVAN